MHSLRVVSVNIGEKRTITFNNRTIETGIFKRPVEGSIFLDSEHVRGDTISDRKHHGGVDQAVYGYSAIHYSYWGKKYDLVNKNYGVFGENITFSELEESEIHLGNVYRCGDIRIQAAGPRIPCFKLGIVFKTQQIVKEFWQTTKCGVYFKVLTGGEVRSGDVFVLEKENTNQPTIAELFQEHRPKSINCE
ncbi:MAG TPA: MOSC domain-containing protein [Flavobacteriales bacterium]|nr:MOSC domain-containing protein [Flavobacteriales bacterium]